MSTFFMLLLTWMIGGFIINVLCRLLIKSQFHGNMNITNMDDYTRGFGTGTTNLKMYYYTTGQMPSLDWLTTNMEDILNTREKLEATLNEEEKSYIYISETRK